MWTLVARSSKSRWLPFPRPKSYSVEKLRQHFLDPDSPFHIAPGTHGPSSPDEAALSREDRGHASAEAAKKLAVSKGFDPFSFWEQPVVWGDLDSFRHVNNVKYLRFLESGRMQWLQSWRHDLGDQQVADILSGKGVGVILKSIDIKFKRPVLYPDTLLISHKPHSLTPTSFGVQALIQSYSQNRIVAESDSVIVWYDFNALKKCEPPDNFIQVVRSRVSDT